MPYSQQMSFTFTNHINYNLMSMITLYVITHNKSANCPHANTRDHTEIVLSGSFLDIF